MGISGGTTGGTTGGSIIRGSRSGIPTRGPFNAGDVKAGIPGYKLLYTLCKLAISRLFKRVPLSGSTNEGILGGVGLVYQL